MDISFMSGEENLGREDRLVRACVALSLFLLGAFGVLASGGIGVIALLFVLVGSYFALTAGAAWDPVYARTGMDTRAEADLAAASAGDGAGAPSVPVVTLPEAGSGERAGADPSDEQPWVASVLSR